MMDWVLRLVRMVGVMSVQKLVEHHLDGVFVSLQGQWIAVSCLHGLGRPSQRCIAITLAM